MTTIPTTPQFAPAKAKMPTGLVVLLTIMGTFATLVFGGIAIGAAVTAGSGSKSAPAAAAAPASSEPTAAEWGSYATSMAPVMIDFDNYMNYALSATDNYDVPGVAGNLDLAGQALLNSPDSPDNGQVSGLIHAAGQRYTEAADAVRMGDFDSATLLMDQGTSNIERATALLPSGSSLGA